jgi:hypothetical protein
MSLPRSFNASAGACASPPTIVHRRGLVDQVYVDPTGDSRLIIGSQVQLSASDVNAATDDVHDAAMVFLQCWRNRRFGGDKG